MSTAAERLVRARTEAGCETAAEGAARAEVKYYTYVQHESGTRGISKDKATRYGRAFGVEPSWLLYGKGRQAAPSEALIPIIGQVNDDTEGTIIPPKGESDRVPLPAGGTEHTRAVEMISAFGQQFAPSGSILYFEDERRLPTPEIIGHPSIVEDERGHLMLCRIFKGSRPGVYDLELRSGEIMQDVNPKWAEEVTDVTQPNKAQRIIRRAGERRVA